MPARELAREPVVQTRDAMAAELQWSPESTLLVCRRGLAAAVQVLVALAGLGFRRILMRIRKRDRRLLSFHRRFKRGFSEL